MMEQQQDCHVAMDDDFVSRWLLGEAHPANGDFDAVLDQMNSVDEAKRSVCFNFEQEDWLSDVMSGNYEAARLWDCTGSA